MTDPGIDHREYAEQARRPRVRFALDAHGHLCQAFINDQAAAVVSVEVRAEADKITTCEINAGPVGWFAGLPNTDGDDPLIIEGYLVPTPESAEALATYLEDHEGEPW